MPRPRPTPKVAPTPVLVAVVAAHGQNLAAPDRPVGAVTGAVERRDHRRPLRDPMLGEQRQRVRVVVLDAEQLDPALIPVPLRPRGRRVVGVQVVDDEVRRDPPHRQHPLDRLAERRLRHRRPHVPDVRRHVGHARVSVVPAIDDGERVLQFTSDGEDVPGRGAVVTRGRQGKRQGREAARPPDRTRAEEHRILHGHVNAAIMQQKCVRDVREPLPRRRVVVAQRLARRVAGRGHERLVDEKLVQRRIRQHHPDVAEAGRDRRGEFRRGAGGVGAQRRNHDRVRRRGEQRQLGVPELGEALGGPGVGGHHREGLGGAVLAAAQLGDGVLVGRVAHEVEAADALHREDRAVVEKLAGARDGGRHEFGGAVGFGSGSAGFFEPQPRAAVEAADRLGVMAAVARVGVLGGACRAQGELAHRGVRAVVGDVLDDGQARPAIDARDERVAEAPVARIPHLREAVGAGGDIRRQQRRRTLGTAGFQDFEGGCGIGVGIVGAAAAHGQLAHLVAEDPRERRGVAKHLRDEGVDLRRHALDLDEHLAVVVAAEPGDAMPGGDGGDVRAEPHALDHAAQQVLPPDFAHDASLTPTRIALTGVPHRFRGCAQSNSGVTAGQGVSRGSGLQVTQIRV